MAIPARATTRAASRVLSAMLGATSWCRCRDSPPGRSSTPGWRRNATNARATFSATHRDDRGTSRRGLGAMAELPPAPFYACDQASGRVSSRSEEHTSELQSREKLVCRLRLEEEQIA